VNCEPSSFWARPKAVRSPTQAPTQTIVVDAEQAGGRLDVFLASRMAPGSTRSQIARAIRAGAVTLNGLPARPAATIRTGDRVEIAPVAVEHRGYGPVPASIAQSAQLKELFADDDIIVVDKPAGLAVHPAPSCREATLVEILLARYPELAAMVEADGVVRPGIVHRLDKGTSGVMVVARTPRARAILSRQFKERTTGKVYLALAMGGLAGEAHTVALPIGRHPADRTRMSVRSARPREALTELRVLQRFEITGPKAAVAYVSLLRVEPKTGRTHQIRVHLAALGHPCLGDPVYCKGAQALVPVPFERQALHALALSFEHPRSMTRLRFVAPLPDDFSQFLAARGITVDQDLLHRWVNGKT
jgi:23S rRNA pseudouridine1911/1915/1917 synthase